ncbi:MAG: biosynthetic arginine decarboxylase [Candidatus Kapaibacterium sp.]|nr:biosynthetic arginine decarboxylase [Ignavibacteria bacterium]
MQKWKIEDAEELYNIKGWGIDFFGINEKGNVTFQPNNGNKDIDIKEVLDELSVKDFPTPVLFRFPEIIEQRISKIFECFENASEEYEFKGKCTLIYPIKVNQMSPVVNEIMNSIKERNVGLEAGSKPELHAVLAMIPKNAPIICNGYKDESFIEMALLAQKMGNQIFLVVEKLNELKMIIKVAERLHIKPNIGIRIKLASSGSGKWEESGGDTSKFGLNAAELLEAVEYARDNGMIDCVNLIHFHLGSQITKIRNIKNALREVSHFYVELRKLGCNIENVDIGGGLGVDYDGTKSSNSSSVNYSIQEYINDAVYSIADVCNKYDLPHPNLITESGRAITAHHSVLIFDVLEKTSQPYFDGDFPEEFSDNELVQELINIHDSIKKSRMLEPWHDAQQIRQEALDLFSLGHLELTVRAEVEKLFWTIARKVYLMISKMKRQPLDFDELSKMLADKYFCNFSVFQSLPDSWAIDQIFPIMPIHRLDEQPKRRGTIEDITCDSDGKINHFIGEGELSNTLTLHDLKEDEPYYLAAFLIGAYQEILGDMHNLFGDTNTVHVRSSKKGYKIEEMIDGERVSEVLEYVEFSHKKLVRTMESRVAAEVKKGTISAKEGKELLSIYKSGLYGYTYLE